MSSLEIEKLACCLVCGGEDIEVIDVEVCLCSCKSCGYVFDNPRPTLEALVGFYSSASKYDSWLAEEGARSKLWAKRLKKVRQKARPGNLLDVGAGIGQFLDLARPYFTKVFGTEVSSSAVAIANRKYGLQLLHGTLDSLQLAHQSFDNITLFHVLEHVPNPRQMIEKCFSLLREGGVLFVAVPNDYRPLKSKIRAWLAYLGVKRFRGVPRLGLRRIRLDGSMEEIHLSHFKVDVLRFLLDSCGLNVIKADIDPYYVPLNGLAGIKQDLRYLSGFIVHKLCGVNVYDTIWMVARKPGTNSLVRPETDSVKS